MRRPRCSPQAVSSDEYGRARDLTHELGHIFSALYDQGTLINKEE